MFQFNQEDTAGRIHPAQFDTVLPPAARSELLQPRRPRILTRPPSPSKRPPQADLERSRGHPARGWLLALAGVAAVCTLIGLNWPSPQKRAAALQESARSQHEAEAAAARAMEALRKQSAPVAQPTPEPIVQPTPAQPVSQPLEPPPPAVSAPRAQLVLYKRWAGNGVWELIDSTGRTVNILVDPVPRAELVSIPVGSRITIPLPFGETRLCTFRGYVPTFDALPVAGVPNDFLIAKDTSIPWVWIADARNGLGSWIDP